MTVGEMGRGGGCRKMYTRVFEPVEPGKKERKGGLQ